MELPLQTSTIGDISMLFAPEGFKVLVHHQLEEKILLGKAGKCRYCGKVEGEVTFKKIAHALPELIGNKYLFSLDECDGCNVAFDKELENNLANFLGIARTTTGVVAKNGVPAHKTQNGERLEKIGKNHLSIELRDSEFVAIDKNRNILSFNSQKSTYVPLQVYKCFVKMALAVLPEADLKNYQQCFDWVRFNKLPGKFNKSALKISETFVPGENPIPNIWIALFKRTGDKKKNPNLICAIAFRNFLFYFNVPFGAKDKLLDYEKMEEHQIPRMYFLPGQMGKSSTRQIDLSRSTAVKEQDVAYMQLSETTEETTGEISLKDLPEDIRKRIEKMGLSFALENK
ncbi:MULTISPECIES: hypothetical protein [unclassified Herbaspirillum]|uniref:hypothetical protein n=2 Tax=Herbaspirillum TaxID=963 RepID=UPI00257BA772|nr:MULTISPECIES: hypothetical protein [unclassified Herbaspirillum]|tara:strand:+ start:2548 stop:3576 length:1029 start_codon:yes stop_codon:yes gene_type:complete